MRKYSEARKDSNRKWDSNNLDRMSYTVPKGHRATVQAAAYKVGESINLFTQRALLARMGLESWPAIEKKEDEQ